MFLEYLQLLAFNAVGLAERPVVAVVLVVGVGMGARDGVSVTAPVVGIGEGIMLGPDAGVAVGAD